MIALPKGHAHRRGGAGSAWRAGDADRGRAGRRYRARGADEVEAESATDPMRIAEIEHPARRYRSAFGAGPRRDRAATGSASTRRRSSAPAPTSPAAGACASRSPPCCSPSPISCCSTSRPTISISKARCGFTTISSAIRTACWSSATIANCSTPASITSCISTSGKLTIYRGGYTISSRQRAEKQMQHLAKAREKQDAERKHLQSFVDRFKAKASKARQAQSRVKRLEKMESIAEMVDRDVQPFSLPGAGAAAGAADDRAGQRQRRLWRAQGAATAQPFAGA
jgi:hypothetical protein